jgi:hypothetical protein
VLGETLFFPFSLLEMNLPGKAGKLEILNCDDFANDVSAIPSVYSVRILTYKLHLDYICPCTNL